MNLKFSFLKKPIDQLKQINTHNSEKFESNTANLSPSGATWAMRYHSSRHSLMYLWSSDDLVQSNSHSWWDMLWKCSEKFSFASWKYETSIIGWQRIGSSATEFYKPKIVLISRGNRLHKTLRRYPNLNLTLLPASNEFYYEIWTWIFITLNNSNLLFRFITAVCWCFTNYFFSCTFILWNFWIRRWTFLVVHSFNILIVLFNSKWYYFPAQNFCENLFHCNVIM